MKTELKYWLVTIIFTGVAIASFYSCKKDDDPTEPLITSISGVVQKGPFVSGADIKLYELNSSFNRTGISFYTKVNSDIGSFEITNTDLAIPGFMEVAADGFYFNEISGELIDSHLNLTALHSGFFDPTGITDYIDGARIHREINVNILTHLEKERVIYLIKKEGYHPYYAKEIALSEILSNFFGYDDYFFLHSENLDYSSESYGASILLALSIILQGGRNAAELTELLGQISNEIREDGVFNNDSIITNLRETTLALNLEEIRNNLESRYAELGFEATIPNFEYFIEVFLNHTDNEFRSHNKDTVKQSK